MHTISSNGYSFDQQVIDAVDYIRGTDGATYANIIRSFPELPNLIMSGSWVDNEAMGIDPDYMSWVADALEETGLVWWEEGEPWAGERPDDDD